jgi:hypothetical protein
MIAVCLDTIFAIGHRVKFIANAINFTPRVAETIKEAKSILNESYKIATQYSIALF